MEKMLHLDKQVSNHVEMYVNRLNLWKITYRFKSQNTPERTKNID